MVSSEIWSDAFAPTGRIDHFNLPRALPRAMLFCPFRPEAEVAKNYLTKEEITPLEYFFSISHLDYTKILLKEALQLLYYSLLFLLSVATTEAGHCR